MGARVVDALMSDENAVLPGEGGDYHQPHPIFIRLADGVMINIAIIALVEHATMLVPDGFIMAQVKQTRVHFIGGHTYQVIPMPCSDVVAAIAKAMKSGPGVYTLTDLIEGKAYS